MPQFRVLPSERHQLEALTQALAEHAAGGSGDGLKLFQTGKLPPPEPQHRHPESARCGPPEKPLGQDLAPDGDARTQKLRLRRSGPSGIERLQHEVALSDGPLDERAAAFVPSQNQRPARMRPLGTRGTSDPHREVGELADVVRAHT